MTRNYPYKFRLEPTEEQKTRLKHYGFTCRSIYNLALDQRNLSRDPKPLPTLLEMWEKREADKLAGVKPERKERNFEEERKQEVVHKNINYGFQSPQMTVLRREVEWMQDVPFSCLQETLRSLQTAFKNFFDRVKKGQRVSDGRNPYGYPVYRSRYRLSIPFKPANVSIKKVSERAGGEEGAYFSELKVPLMGSLIRFRQDRPVLGTPKTPTLKLEGDGKWYVVILTEQEVEDPQTPEAEVGIDLGVAKMITLSDGTIYPLTKKQQQTFTNIDTTEKRIRKLQAACDRRKTKFSKNWIKVKRQVVKLKHRQKRSRESLHHEITHLITSGFGRVAVENLNIKGMTPSASGTEEEPGTNVAQKSGLNREILKRGWGLLVSQLEYKAEWRGGEVIKVDPKYTGQTCSKCGHVEKANRATQATFLCQKCGHKENADVNAAKNILTRAEKQ